MKLEWIEAIMNVVKFGSFTKAAEATPCSQSTVSRYVKSTEDELEMKIFERAPNSNVVKLTPEGERILPLIEKIIHNYYELRDLTGTSKRQGKQTHLSIGIDSRTFSSATKGNLISLLYMSYPEIFLTVEEINSSAYIEQLVMGKVDAVLFTHVVVYGDTEQEIAALNDSTLRYDSLGMQPLSIAFGERFAPKNKEQITFKELKGERFIFNTDIRRTVDLSDKKNRHAMFLRACHSNNFEPEIVTVGGHYADIKPQLAMQGKGVFPSTIPAFLRERSGLCYIPVGDSPYYVEYYLLSLKKNQQAITQKFIAFMRKHFIES